MGTLAGDQPGEPVAASDHGEAAGCCLNLARRLHQRSRPSAWHDRPATGVSSGVVEPTWYSRDLPVLETA